MMGAGISGRAPSRDETRIEGWVRPVGADGWRWTFQHDDGRPYDWCGTEPPRATLIIHDEGGDATEGRTHRRSAVQPDVTQGPSAEGRVSRHSERRSIRPNTEPAGGPEHREWCDFEAIVEDDGLGAHVVEPCTCERRKGERRESVLGPQHDMKASKQSGLIRKLGLNRRSYNNRRGA